MADYNDIEDLRDWMIDNCGEFLAKLDALNGDEPPAIIENIRIKAEEMHQCGLEAIKLLDELLIQKKRAE